MSVVVGSPAVTGVVVVVVVKSDPTWWSLIIKDDDGRHTVPCLVVSVVGAVSWDIGGVLREGKVWLLRVLLPCLSSVSMGAEGVVLLLLMMVQVVV